MHGSRPSSAQLARPHTRRCVQVGLARAGLYVRMFVQWKRGVKGAILIRSGKFDVFWVGVNWQSRPFGCIVEFWLSGKMGIGMAR